MADPAQLALLEYFRVTRNPTSADSRRRGEAEWVRQEDVLGYGACSIVYLETDNRTGAARAVKEVRKRANPDFKQELIALTRLSRPAYAENFGQFLGWWETDAIVAYILPYFEHGDLRKFMTTPWLEEDVKDVASQLLSGLNIMHQDGFTHRDLKPENIFVAHTKPFFKIKIGDFGVSKRVFDETLLRTFVGTRNYLAPEVLELLDEDGDDDSDYTNAVDIWAVGGIIFELLTTSRPFKSRRELKQYCTGKLEFPTEPLESSQVSSNGRDFVAHLLAPEPTERLDAKTALANIWFETTSIPSQVVEVRDAVLTPAAQSASEPTSHSQDTTEGLENLHTSSSSSQDTTQRDSENITDTSGSTTSEPNIGKTDPQILRRYTTALSMSSIGGGILQHNENPRIRPRLKEARASNDDTMQEATRTVRRSKRVPILEQRLLEKREERNLRRAAEATQVPSPPEPPQQSLTIGANQPDKAKDTPNTISLAERLKQPDKAKDTPNTISWADTLKQMATTATSSTREWVVDSEGVVSRSIWKPVKSDTVVPTGVKTVTDPSGQYQFLNLRDRVPFWIDPKHPNAKPELGPLPAGWVARMSRWSGKLEFYNYLSKKKTTSDPRETK